MKHIPILYSTMMVQAKLAKRKSMTRRLSGLDKINKAPHVWRLESLDFEKDGCWAWFSNHISRKEVAIKCPYGQPGDVLWVRESWRPIEQDFGQPRYEYKATEKINLSDKWRPSIHMPKAACRMWDKVKAVRVERLQDISEKDAMAEGVLQYEDGYWKNYMTKKSWKESDGVYCMSAVASFQTLWMSINGVESWEANPWVWVVEFEPCEMPEGFL